LCEVEVPVLAAKLVGVNRIGAQGIVLRSLRNNEKITARKLSALKKEILEKESFDKLEFVESSRTLDDVAGHVEAKRWLREDARLLKRDARRALPMGYLLCGRIGTGKTYLAQCFAGECGVPFVELKNFREKWVGSTEGNLEKVLRILKALGQVVVFVDEADQAMGKRESGEGDSGLSGRIYAMLAKEMADTDNRGRILWLFATSRPDLLEVDLKRQGRLDVHIPLFPPSDAGERRELFHAMAVKLKMGLKAEELPDLPFDAPVSGNELEGLLVRAVREFELQAEGEGRKPLPEILKAILADFRPSAHTKRLELMDLLAVKECTDSRFLPERFRSLDPEAVERRIRELEMLVEA
jgi:SpoVK/Ycf46/Vps4 family AAA+-type ATPase